MKKDISQLKFQSIVGWRGDSLVCPQAFGGDIYNGCSFDCFFCFCREMEEELFTKYYSGWSRKLVRGADPILFKNLFDKAFGSDKETTDWNVQCLRYGLPFNMGSKSETFQYANDERLIKVLELFQEYKVPIIFETKSIYLGLSSYFDIIKNLKAAVIVSIMGGSDTLNYKLEENCPPASSRWSMVKELNRLGIWTAVRWEPIMPTINGSNEDLQGFADNAKKYGARHISLYNYRSSNYYKAAMRFKQNGFNYEKMLEASLDENWRPIGKSFFGMLRKNGIKASSPDFINFPFDSDCISCCGTDELFKPYLFNFQYACHIIKQKGIVCWEDMESIIFKEPTSYERMKACWNGGGNYYSLKDSPEIAIAGKDSKGYNIYGRIEMKDEYFLKPIKGGLFDE